MSGFQFFQVLITIVLALSGWFVVHKFTSLRELKNKQREIRIRYLLNTYNKLVRAVDSNDKKIIPDLESAIAEIQLLGTREQIKLANEFGQKFANKGSANLNKLLQLLRDDLRNELNLEYIKSDINFLRINSLNKR